MCNFQKKKKKERKKTHTHTHTHTHTRLFSLELLVDACEVSNIKPEVMVVVTSLKGCVQRITQAATPVCLEFIVACLISQNPNQQHKCQTKYLLNKTPTTKKTGR